MAIPSNLPAPMQAVLEALLTQLKAANLPREDKYLVARRLALIAANPDYGV